MTLKLLQSKDNDSYPSDTESWTSSLSSNSSPTFNTPKTSLTADLIDSFEELGATMPDFEAHPLIPGIYCILSSVDPTCSLDLSGYDNESIIAYGCNGGENQLWKIAHLGPGYSIKSVSPDKFVTLKDRISTGGQMRGSTFPMSWVIERAEGDSSSENSSWIIRWPESDFIIDAPEGGKGHIIQLQHVPANEPTQPPTSRWLFVPQFDDQAQDNSAVMKKLDTFNVRSDPNVTKSVSNTVVNTDGLKEGGNGEIAITVTTTTTSTSITTIKKLKDLW